MHLHFLLAAAILLLQGVLAFKYRLDSCRELLGPDTHSSPILNWSQYPGMPERHSGTTEGRAFASEWTRLSPSERAKLAFFNQLAHDRKSKL